MLRVSGPPSVMRSLGRRRSRTRRGGATTHTAGFAGTQRVPHSPARAAAALAVLATIPLGLAISAAAQVAALAAIVAVALAAGRRTPPRPDVHAMR
jgi:hypothetical protein